MSTPSPFKLVQTAITLNETITAPKVLAYPPMLVNNTIPAQPGELVSLTLICFIPMESSCEPHLTTSKNGRTIYISCDDPIPILSFEYNLFVSRYEYTVPEHPGPREYKLKIIYTDSIPLPPPATANARKCKRGTVVVIVINAT